tara:strand:+ start:168 stop:680 length:513 start_codon:yes stop_codon:yes gene_type:complete
METSDYICSCKDHIKKVTIPAWEEYFMAMAFVASTRSKDSQTKHGCVITDSKNRILGIGYNSFPVDMPDDILPNVRPKKYKWMVHAERNALSNCSIRPENGIAYITGKPCIDCAKSMYQEGIRKFVCFDGHGTYLTDEEDGAMFDILTSYGKVKVSYIKPNFSEVLSVLK